MARKAQSNGDAGREKYVNAMIDNLPLLRAKLGLSQEQLGKRIGISRQQIANFENRKRRLTWASYLALTSVFSEEAETKKMLVLMGICAADDQDEGKLSDDDLSLATGGLTQADSMEFEVVYAGNLSAAQIRGIIQSELRARGVPETVIANTPNMEVCVEGAGSGGKLRIIWRKGEQSISYISIY